jgi:hypothetical protein
MTKAAGDTVRKSPKFVIYEVNTLQENSITFSRKQLIVGAQLPSHGPLTSTTCPLSSRATLTFLVEAFLGFFASKISLSSSNVFPAVSTKKK